MQTEDMVRSPGGIRAGLVGSYFPGSQDKMVQEPRLKHKLPSSRAFLCAAEPRWYNATHLSLGFLSPPEARAPPEMTL